MNRQPTKLSEFTSDSVDVDDGDLHKIFNLPAEHVVQTLSNQYIRSDVLAKFLDSRFESGKWGLVTRLSYHVIIVPNPIESFEITALMRKSSKATRQWPTNAGHNLYAAPAASMTAAFSAEKKRIFIRDEGDQDSENISVVQVEPNTPVRIVSLENTEAAVVAYLKQQQQQEQEPSSRPAHAKAISTTIILIHQSFSWAELDITAPAAQALFTHFGISPGFWHVVKKFGSKVSNDQDIGGGFNELVLPAASDARTSESSSEISFEISYTAKHAEEHFRPERASYDPWSIRQIGVEHRYDPATDANIFVILNPSRTLVQRINALGSDTQTLDVHRLVLGAVTERWGEYLAHLESVCKEISAKAVLARTPQRLPDCGFDVHFSDAQTISDIRDRILRASHMLDLNLSIFENLLTAISHIDPTRDRPNRVHSSLSSLSSQTKRWKSQTENLLQRLDGSAALVRSILDSKALATLQTSSALSAELAALARADALTTKKDARTLSIITVLGFLYLPASFVASLLGTQYININHNGDGKMSITVAPEMVIFAVLTLILLGLTYGGWLIWDQHLQRADRAEEEKDSEKKV
ncbi:hypothetical protein UA08_06717 [Talaromyces atroroseus]|uniref:CorA-like transporter domain-containing protein n=1 Tax=Talaromyces atroroseus TaxID=1441469 RepID=A0A225AX71_TALAT|nr:hypothetical protein UA08_06717 [Talaromyces atroroseus]OKL58097.1 hypothetical protein UA08_06717 [Talaromyces atroroseus]